MRHLPTLLGVALLSGCLTTPVQRVESLGAGNFEMAVEGGVSTIDQRPLPTGNVALRFGVSDRVDLGIRAGTWLYELQSKLRLTADEARTPVALAPSATFIYARDPFDSAAQPQRVGLAFVYLPVLVGVPLGPHQLVLGPGANTILGGSDEGFRFGVEGRMSAGVSLRLAEGLRLHPEVAIGVGGVSVGTGGSQSGGPSVRGSAVVGLAFGNGDHAR